MEDQEFESFLAPEKGIRYTRTENECLEIGDHIACPIQNYFTYHHGIVTNIGKFERKVIDFNPSYKKLDEASFKTVLDTVPGVFNERSIYDFLEGCNHFYVVKYKNDTAKKSLKLQKASLVARYSVYCVTFKL